jgi:hypothetical protein
MISSLCDRFYCVWPIDLVCAQASLVEGYLEVAKTVRSPVASMKSVPTPSRQIVTHWFAIHYNRDRGDTEDTEGTQRGDASESGSRSTTRHRHRGGGGQRVDEGRGRLRLRYLVIIIHTYIQTAPRQG